MVMVWMHRPPAALQALGDGGEIGRPVMFAHRLEHLDGYDIVEAAFRAAIILQPYVGRAVQAAGGEFVLGGRNGEAGDSVIVGGRALGEAAPAAADLQHTGLGPLEFGEDALILCFAGRCRDPAVPL